MIHTHWAASLPQNGKFLMSRNRQEKLEPSRTYNFLIVRGLLSRVISPWNAACIDSNDLSGVHCRRDGSYWRWRRRGSENSSIYVVFHSLILTGYSRVYGCMVWWLLFFVIISDGYAGHQQAGVWLATRKPPTVRIVQERIGWSWNGVREKYCWSGWSWSWWLEWCEKKLLQCWRLQDQPNAVNYYYCRIIIAAALADIVRRRINPAKLYIWVSTGTAREAFHATARDEN